jgi:uncharacterized protein (DUF2236 family)
LSVQTVRPPLLGPRSLSWRYAGDQRMILIGPWVGLVQLSLPGLGAGVEQHSAFYTEPWDRFLRSVPQIAGVVYDGPKAEQTGHGIRDLHHDIKGVDSEGRRYHALDPEVYYWAHATMSEAVIKMLDTLDHPSTTAEKELLFREQQVVYARYGVSDRPAPADRPGFERYLDHTYAHVLEKTPAVEAFIEMAHEPASMTQPWIPQPLWRMISPVVSNPMWLLGVGLLAPSARETLGLSWTDRDERKLGRLTAAIRRAWPLIPRRLRYMPRAKAAFRREGWPARRYRGVDGHVV